jgi:hypothetical protein
MSAIEPQESSRVMAGLPPGHETSISLAAMGSRADRMTACWANGLA